MVSYCFFLTISRDFNLPTKNENGIGKSDERLSAVDITQLSVECLRCRAGDGKTGDQPCRVAQVVELGGNVGVRGQQDGAVAVSNKDA